jgi:hypothetical protein
MNIKITTLILMLLAPNIYGQPQLNNPDLNGYVYIQYVEDDESQSLYYIDRKEINYVQVLLIGSKYEVFICFTDTPSGNGKHFYFHDEEEAREFARRIITGK